ncbi:MAG: tetratricopeptide repeat protein [Deltaproteobacteria bacterium]|nr:tetratricopeptide repeat protein [Deltaproteobacteria bacterium]
MLFSHARLCFFTVLLISIASACTPHPLILQTRPSQSLRAKTEPLREAAIDKAAEGADPASAQQNLKAVLALSPTDVQARWWAAQFAALQGDREQAFQHWLAAAATNHPLAEVAMREASRSLSQRPQAQQLAQVLEAVVARPETSPLVRARALDFLGITRRSLGDFSGAEAAFADLNPIREWMLLGPFDNDQNAGFEQAFPPEQGLQNFEGRFKGKLKQVAWRPVKHFDYDGSVPLESLLDPHRWATAYLVSHVHSDVEQDVSIRLGAHRGVKAWVNGELLLSNDDAHRARLDQHVVSARLRSGWNRLMIKVCQRTGRWQLRLRLTSPDGSALDNIRCDRTWHDVSGGPSAKTQTPSASLNTWFANPGRIRGAGLDIIEAWWWHRQGFQKAALRRLLELTAKRPQSALHQVLLAELHFDAGHDGLALKALVRAEAITPGLPWAVLRRVEHETDQKRPERAMRILAPLLKLNPVPQDIESFQALLLLRRGWNVDALRAIKTSLASRPHRSWTWKVRGILHRRLDQHKQAWQATRRALALQADDLSSLDWLIKNALQRQRPTEALTWLKRKQRTWPSNVSAILQEVEIKLAHDDAPAATAALNRAEAIATDHWRVHKLRGDIHYRVGDKKQALAAYERSLVLQPDNPRLREYVDFLLQRKDLIFERYALDEARIQQILAQAPAKGTHADADAVFMLDDHITHVFSDGSAKHLVRQIYYIQSPQGQRSLSQFRVPASSSFKLELAETVQPDGSRQEATSIRKGVIHLPNVQPGSILHVAYRYESSSTSWMEDHFSMSFNFQGDFPSQLARWVVVLPKEKKLIHYVRGKRVQHQQEALDQEQAHIFSLSQATMIHREPWRPPLRDLRSAVYVSTVPNWEELARWQNSLIQDQFEIDEDIRSLTQSLVAKAKTQAEKIDAIYRFVARDIRYLDHDVGIMGKKPNKAVNIFENRFGDCKDKATLMIAMLREVGIKAHYAAVRTRNKGLVLWEVPYAQSNHIITYIPAQEGLPQALFVDGTARYGHFQYLSSRDQGIQALVLTGKSHEIVRTPLLPPGASAMRVEILAKLGDGDELQMEAEETWTGMFASSNRHALVTEGKRAEEWAKRLNRRYPGARLEKVEFEGLDDLGPKAQASYRFIAPGRIRQEGETLRLDLIARSRLLDRYARHPKRHSDLFTMRAYTTEETIRLSLPADREVQSLPKNHLIDNDLLTYEIKWSQKDQEVVVKLRLVWKKRIIPQARYPELRRLLVQTDLAEEQDLVLKRRQVARVSL